MSYWQKTKRIAWDWLTGWRIIPGHLSAAASDVGRAARHLLGALASVAMLLVCVIAPLLFWLAPLLTLVVQRLEAREEARRKKQREELVRSMTGLCQREGDQ